MHDFLAWANFENAVQDNWPSDKSRQGRPVGATFDSRMIHVPGYIGKVMDNPTDKEGPVKPQLIGTVRQMMNGVLDNFCYQGRTLTERIIDSRTTGWLDKPGRQGVVDQRFIPDEANRNWMVAIQRSAQVMETLQKGFNEGRFQNVAQFKLEEGKTIINSKMIDALVTFHRLATEYRTFTEAGPALAIKKSALEEEALRDHATELAAIADPVQKNQRTEAIKAEAMLDHLSSDFNVIEIRDRQGNVIDSVSSRFFQFYDANIQELGMWLQDPDDTKKIGEKTSYVQCFWLGKNESQ